MGALPLGAAAGGTLARSYGLTAPYWMGSAVMLVTAFALLPILNNRAVRDARGA